jgi:hypothetical protein
MKRIPSFVALLLLGVATPQLVAGQMLGPSDYIKQAIKASGGADALHNLRRLTIRGEAKHWEPGQSLVAGGEPRPLDDSKLAITWDLEKKWLAQTGTAICTTHFPVPRGTARS